MRKNFLQSMKEIFRDWDLKVMSYVMLVVTATCVITATVAWFTCSAYASVRNMEIQTASAEVIKVAVKTGGEDVDVIRAAENEPQVTITMPVFANVTQSGEDADKKVLAPGTYGSFTIYVTPLKSDITACEILPSFSCSKTNEDGEESREWLTYISSLSPEEKAEIEQLVKGHILLFSNYDSEKGYSGLIAEGVELEQYKLEWDSENNVGEETPITIYWYWPYDYKDVQNLSENDVNILTNEMLFDLEKIERESDDLSTSEKSRLYDFADTKIGTNVESVKFHFEVKAIYGSNS